jgi:hypothetical protein
MSLALIGVPVLGCVDYRPQWFYPTPRGVREEPFVYFYDIANAAYATLAPSSTQENIPLMIETGSKFMWRGVRLNKDGTTHGMPITLLVRFTDPYGNALSSDWVPVIQYVNPSGSAAGGLPVPIEPEIDCPAGSGILASFKNADANNSVALPEITLYGMKRYEGVS